MSGAFRAIPSNEDEEGSQRKARALDEDVLDATAARGIRTGRNCSTLPRCFAEYAGFPGAASVAYPGAAWRTRYGFGAEDDRARSETLLLADRQ